jgi:hypothetical protein
MQEVHGVLFCLQWSNPTARQRRRRRAALLVPSGVLRVEGPSACSAARPSRRLEKQCNSTLTLLLLPLLCRA